MNQPRSALPMTSVGLGELAPHFTSSVGNRVIRRVIKHPNNNFGLVSRNNITRGTAAGYVLVVFTGLEPVTPTMSR